MGQKPARTVRRVNVVFLFLVVASVVVAAFTGKMDVLGQGTFKSAQSAVELAIQLVGQMTLWLGMLAILEKTGFMLTLSRVMKPVMKRLFKDVPAEHPAMGAMILNLSASMLGLGNAATPFGLKAMVELNKLNARPGVATNAMALFLSINTAGVAVLALDAVGVRASVGSHDPAGIVLPSAVVTFGSALVAVAVCKWVQSFSMFAPERYPVDGAPTPLAAVVEAPLSPATEVPAAGWRAVPVVAVLLCLALALAEHLRAALGTESFFKVSTGVFSSWLLPLLMVAIVTAGYARHVKVYETFIGGAKEGFSTCVTLIPYLVAIIVVVGMFRNSGLMDALVSGLGPLLKPLGFPPEALPMALIRPFSGSGSTGIMLEALNFHGADSFIGYLVSVMKGSMETTFYVIAVYFGAVGVRRMRHTLIPCLAADVAGVVLATIVCHFFFAHVPLSLAK